MDGRFVSEHTPHSLSASGNTDWTVCGTFSGVGVSRPVSTRPGEKKSRCPRSISTGQDGAKQMVIDFMLQKNTVFL